MSITSELEELCCKELGPNETAYTQSLEIADFLIKSFVNILELPEIDKSKYPTLVSPYFEESSLELLKPFEKEISSSYNQEINCIYLLKGEAISLAEECMHFINAYSNKEIFKKRCKDSAVDIFYTQILREAIAFFGVNFIIERECDISALKNNELIGFFEKHLYFENTYKTEEFEIEDLQNLLMDILDLPKENLSAVIHLLGYNLGERLYESAKEIKYYKEDFRELLSKNFREKGSAMMGYLTLVEFLE